MEQPTNEAIREEIRDYFHTPGFTLDNMANKLRRRGYDEATAR
ncbi:hypothetical protein [Paraflavitalea pollutisoli]|nr:hypothetical protein [Paraflavitalea sp. H1-2-19X]